MGNEEIEAIREGVHELGVVDKEEPEREDDHSFAVEDEGDEEDEEKDINDRLLNAAVFDDVDVLEKLLDQGADINHADGEGETALHIAARFGNEAVVRALLRRKADVSVRDNDGWTPLIGAPMGAKGAANITRDLLSHGADVNAQNKDGETALLRAMLVDESFELMSALLDKHAAVDGIGLSIIMNACCYSTLEVVDGILKRGARLEDTDDSGCTPLLLAALLCSPEVVELLLERGACVDAKDFTGFTALHRVVYRTDDAERVSIARSLMAKGAKLSATNEQKQTPLHQASEKGYTVMVRTLLDYEEANSKINWCDRLERTALDLAISEGHGDVVTLLVNHGATCKPTADTHESALSLIVGSPVSNKPSQNKARRNAILRMVETASLESAQAVFQKTEKADDQDMLAEAMLIKKGKSSLQDSEIDEYLMRFARNFEKHSIVCELLEVEDFSGEKPETALQWAAYHGNFQVAWWILRTSSPEMGTKADQNKAKKIAKARRDALLKPSEQLVGNIKVHEHLGPAERRRQRRRERQDRGGRGRGRGQGRFKDQKEKPGDTKSQVRTREDRKDKFSLTLDMLNDPPPVVGRSDSQEPFDKPSLGDIPEDKISYYYATIVDFYRANRRVDFLRRSREVFQVVYEKGAEAIMAEARKTLKEISPEAAKEKPYSSENLQFRWIHLPANNMKWMEDLAQRLYFDKQRSKRQYLAMRDFMQKSWQETSGGGCRTGFMKPAFSKGKMWRKKRGKGEKFVGLPDTKQGAMGTSDHTDYDTDFQKRNPEPGETGDLGEDKNSGPREKRSMKTTATRSGVGEMTDELTGLALYMPYIAFGTWYTNGPSADDVSERRHGLFETYGKSVHDPRTLDQFYYRLRDDHERNKDQVVSRALLKKELETAESWPVLLVDQLWLWVIDSKTIITSCTHRRDGSENPIVEKIFNYLRNEQFSQRGHPAPSSVEQMVHFIVNFCIGLIADAKWGRYYSIGKGESAREIFSQVINQKATRETGLFTSFTKKISKRLKAAKEKSKAKANDKEGLEGVNQDTDDDDDDDETDYDYPGWKAKTGYDADSEYSDRKRPAPQEETDDREVEEVEDWKAIRKASKLLEEIKDIGDELHIILTVLKQQNYVWEELIKTSESKNERGPGYIINDMDEMNKMVESLQASVQEILSLEQNGINITESVLARSQADESIRQGKILMLFTISTIIFLPLSFLTSLFALNMSSFPHDEQGNVRFPTSWVLPIIFCASVAFIGILLLGVRYSDSIESAFRKAGWLTPGFRKALDSTAASQKAKWGHWAKDNKLLRRRKTRKAQFDKESVLDEASTIEMGLRIGRPR